jgi:HEAT repeat protein
MPRRRQFPEGPFGSPGAKITVVFYSGTAKEQALEAAVVGDDAANDLAIVKVVGVRDLPRPIDYQRTPELRETMPVVMFGFPLGRRLDPKKKHPAITVAKGSISSLRGTENQLENVQLDIDMPGGYSGGPVVDERGALIGVAYFGWDNTQINLAIPAHKLTRLLQGRIDPPTMLESLTINGDRQIRVRALASDPLGKLRSPTLLYGLTTEVRMPVKLNGPSWPALAGAKSSPMTVQGIQATASLELNVPANGPFEILAQVSYQTATGQKIYGEPRTLRLGLTNPPVAVAGAPQPANPAPSQGPAVAPRPSKTPKGEELTKLLADLKSADEATRQRAASVLQQMPPRQRRDEVRRGLQELLTAAEPATRTAGVLALAACDPKEAGPRLAKLLADDSQVVRHTVTRILKELKDPRTAEALAARLPIEPLTVLDLLKTLGPAAEKALLPYLEEQHAGTARFWTLNILKEIGTAASLPKLEAIQGPEKIHVPGVLTAIRERLPLSEEEFSQALDDLKSTDTSRRVAAARRIAATPPSKELRAEVVSRLEWLLNDQSHDVRLAAAKGIGRWAGPEAIPQLSKRLEGFDPGMHAVLIDVLAEMKTDEAAAAIAKRLPDVHDRNKAVQALKGMDATAVEKAVLPILTNTDVFCRCEVVKLLAIAGGKDSIAPLEKLANDNNAFYSGTAREALAAVKDRNEGEN